jgi:hypothetical protein
MIKPLIIFSLPQTGKKISGVFAATEPSSIGRRKQAVQAAGRKNLSNPLLFFLEKRIALRDGAL